MTEHHQKKTRVTVVESRNYQGPATGLTRNACGAARVLVA